MKLVMLRHGESIWNKENRFTGWMDVDLSEHGRDEAITAGETLKAAQMQFDVCYTSYLKRAIHTLQYVLRELDQEYIATHKAWQLNERHYGALQGLNKAETALQYGDEQVHIWRRSFAICPPNLAQDDERLPWLQKPYKQIDQKKLPTSESLEMTLQRVVTYFNETIRKDLQNHKDVLLVAHGNSIRALCMYLQHISQEDIVDLNIPTGQPLVYELDDNLEVLHKYYL